MPADDPKLSLQQDLERQRGLERDFLTEFLTSRRNAWRVAWSSLTLSGLAIVATAKLLYGYEPPPPHVVRVNDATGEVEHVTRLDDGAEDYGERIARHFIQQYVLACESYDWYTIQNTYNKCGLFSAPSVQQRYRARFETHPHTGEEGMDKRYRDHTRLLVSVRAITLGPNQSATVRLTRLIDGPNQSAPPEQLIATLAYRYLNTPMTEQVGRENPLGFQVTSYTTDVETLR